jgi:hypothetical protein
MPARGTLLLLCVVEMLFFTVAREVTFTMWCFWSAVCPCLCPCFLFPAEPFVLSCLQAVPTFCQTCWKQYSLKGLSLHQSLEAQPRTCTVRSTPTHAVAMRLPRFSACQRASARGMAHIKRVPAVRTRTTRYVFLKCLSPMHQGARQHNHRPEHNQSNMLLV